MPGSTERVQHNWSLEAAWQARNGWGNLSGLFRSYIAEQLVSPLAGVRRRTSRRTWDDRETIREPEGIRRARGVLNSAGSERDNVHLPHQGTIFQIIQF